VGLAGIVVGILLLGMHPAMPRGTTKPKPAPALQPH
jgi:hypothetical protein